MPLPLPLCSTVPGIGFIPQPTEISFSHVLYILIVKLIFIKYSSSIDLCKGNTSMFTDDEGEITDEIISAWKTKGNEKG